MLPGCSDVCLWHWTSTEFGSNYFCLCLVERSPEDDTTVLHVCSTGLPTSLPLCRYQHSHRVGSKLRGNHVFPIKIAGVPGSWSGFQWPQQIFFCHLPHCSLRRAPRQRSTSKPMLSNKPMYSQTETVQPCGEALGNFRMGRFISKWCFLIKISLVA